MTGRAEKIPRIANDLRDLKQLGAAIEAHRLRAGGFSAPAVEVGLPATLEGRLLNIWRKAIGNPHIGMDDNFFDAGGTSLKAVQTVVAIRRELHFNLSIVNIFECPTIHLLCKKLALGEATDVWASEAMERGAKRKQRARRRG